MADVSFDVPEWWDAAGTHHDYSPSDAEMLDEAVQMTVHVYDDEGNDLHFTTFSHDGWEPDELVADVDDAYDHYA